MRPSHLIHIVGTGGLLLVGLGFVSIFVGSGEISFNEVWAVLAGEPATSAAETIVWQMRLPRIPVAIVAGAALGVAGALTQALTRNPLAEPGLMGVNAGAALGVALCYTFMMAPPTGLVVSVAMLGSGIAGLIVLAVGGVLTGQWDSLRLILSGAALSAVVSAVTHWLIVAQPNTFQNFRGWASGTVSNRPLGLMWLCVFLVAVALLAVLSFSGHLGALALGDDMARSMGARPRLTWTVVGGAAIVLTGCATTLVGPIGFLGLVAPLIVRSLAGPSVELLIVGSAIFGAVTLLLADVLGRVVLPPREVAAGILCSLIGGPLFVVVAQRMRVVKL